MSDQENDPMTAAPPCDSATLDGCTTCGRIMHRRHGRTCAAGHSLHKAGGRCVPCYEGERRTYVPGGHWAARDRLLQAWADLAEVGVRFEEFPRHVGKTYQAWERAFQRARNAGHPLAKRYDKENV